MPSPTTQSYNAMGTKQTFDLNRHLFTDHIAISSFPITSFGTTWESNLIPQAQKSHTLPLRYRGSQNEIYK